MSNSLTRYGSTSIERAAGRAIDRTNAMAAVAAEQIAVLGELGREVRRSATQAAMERRAIEPCMPELTDSFEYVDKLVLSAQAAVVMLLAREL